MVDRQGLASRLQTKADSPRPPADRSVQGDTHDAAPRPLDGAAVAEGWGLIRAGLRRDLGARAYDQWLGRARLVGCDPPHWEPVVALPSAFILSWIEERHGERLRLAFRTLLPGTGTLRLVVDDGRESAVRRLEPTVADVVKAAAEPTAESVTVPAAGRPLDARFTFDRFVGGATNRMALNAARSLAAGDGLVASPLFLHSPTGEGKTHLAHALGHALIDADPAIRVECLSSERFTVAFVAAVQANATAAFKQRLRSADLLILDDVQFLAGRGSTQAELLHTLDELIGAGRPIVVTGDRPPHLLDRIEPRICSRLGGGLVADIRPADRALRRAVLDAKLDGRAAVGAAVLDLLADRVTGSVRELEGALNRLLAYGQLSERAIDMALADEVLGGLMAAARRRVTVDDIQVHVARHYRLEREEMLSTRRARAVARPRQVAMYLAKSLTTRSLPEIGRRFERDHTTVLHAVRTVERLRMEDAELDADLRRLTGELQAG